VETMLNDGNVDALVVSTPNYIRAPQTIAALKRNTQKEKRGRQ
jgi:predicted dehydrogenase